MSSQAGKAQAFLNLHHQDQMLVLPNAWDVASARIFEVEGFEAIATTSAGVAASLGYADNQMVPMDEMLGAVRRMAKGVSVPVTADIEGGYSTTAGGTADAVQQFLETGIVGINLEDRDARNPSTLFEIELQSDRIKAVREMAEDEGVHLVINARTDVFLESIGDPGSRFARTVKRSNAFMEAGADCIFIPGAFDEKTVSELLKEIQTPVNIIVGPTTLTLKQLQELGVSRVSLGSGPARAALGFTRRLAAALKNEGSYALMMDGAIPYPEVNALFGG